MSREKSLGPSSQQEGEIGLQCDTAVLPADADTVSEEYQKALREMGVIVNSADNTFKRDYVGVVWKHLTVYT